MEKKEETQGEFKVKKRPKNLTEEVKEPNNVVDLSKKTEEPVAENEQPVEETSVVEGKLEEVVSKNETIEPEKEELNTNRNLPENIDKLVSFMEETGGNVEDYVRLNTDYSNIDNDILLKEYYKNTKPHLSKDEIEYILEDQFSYDEEVDEERTIKKRKIALKEEVVKARTFLENTKNKYYDEIKLRPNSTSEQREALDFFNQHKKQQDLAKQNHDKFKEKTKSFFTNEFKGFEFNVGDKSFNYTVNNAQGVADAQSDISTFIKKFLNDDGSVRDHAGYHKAIYAARNSDNLAKHFYEQGKADAAKDLLAQSKNITNDVRPNPSGDVFVNGLKVRAITGGDGTKLKIKKRT